MNFLTSFVKILVDDKGLPAQLAKAKAAVTRTVSAIKTTFSKMATSFKAAFDKMVRYAKWGGLAIVGGLTLATRAAMKQEDAQFLLAAALKISGEWALSLQHRFEAFAASVQQATIYGDEQVLQLMQLQKSLGVTSDKLEEAAKMSIGLATATGRDVQSMAMYIALAQQGEFTMLRRYIPALRSTTDATEQLRIITEFAAAGFKLAEERAKTSSGALRQMWNALGDVAEVIGGALLQGVKDTAIAIKEWAERNQERIGKWAETTVTHLARVKDFLWYLVKFIRADFSAGVSYSLSVALEIFKGFIEATIFVLKEGGARAAEAFIKEFGMALGVWLMKVGKPEEGILSKLSLLSPAVNLGRIAVMKAGINLAEASLKPERERRDVAEGLLEILNKMKETISNLKVPSGLKEELIGVKKAIQPTTKPDALGIKTLPFTGDINVPPIKTEAERWKAQLSAYELQLSFLEDIKASEQERADIALRLSSKIAEDAQEQVAFIREQDDMTTIARIANLKKYIEENQTALDAVGEAHAILQAEIERLESTRFQKLRDYWNELKSNVEDSLGYLSNKVAEFSQKVESHLSDAFYDAITKAKSWKDATKEFFKDVLRSFIRMLADMAARAVMYAAFQSALGIGGGFGGGGGGGAPSAQHGGKVLKTGLAVIHKGETYSGVPAKQNQLRGETKFTINVNNESPERIEVSPEESYMYSDQRIIDVSIKAMETHGPYRRGLRQARRF